MPFESAYPSRSSSLGFEGPFILGRTDSDDPSLVLTRKISFSSACNFVDGEVEGQGEG